MKKPIKIYLNSDDERKLRIKAKELGFEGRGSLTQYIELIARNPIAILNENVKNVVKALGLK